NQGRTEGLQEAAAEAQGPGVAGSGRAAGGGGAGGRAHGQWPVTLTSPVGGRGPESPPQARVNGDNGLSLSSQQVGGGPAGVRGPAGDPTLRRIPRRGRNPSGRAAADRLRGSPLAHQRLRVVLETLAGTCRTQEACARLGLSEQRLDRLRTRVLQAGLDSLEP